MRIPPRAHDAPPQAAPGTSASDRLAVLGRLRWPPWAGIALALALLHGGALLAHLRASANPLTFNDDVRQHIAPFLHYSDPELPADDYIDTYFLDTLPTLYCGLYTMASRAWDAVPLSKILPYLCLLATVACIGIAASALGSRWAALAAMSLALGGGMLLDRMAGGLLRAFAFPLLAAGAAALVTGRLRLLAALVPLAAGLYPAAAPPLGVALALAALALPQPDRGDLAGSTLRHRVGLVGISALATVLLVAPPAIRSRAYGPLVTPAMAAAYPEAGPGGRNAPEDRAPFARFVPAAVSEIRTALRPGGEPLLTAVGSWLADGSQRGDSQRQRALQNLLIAGLVLGSLALAWRSAPARRLLTLAVAAFLSHLLALLTVPRFYLPPRYVSFPVPVLALVLLPAAIAEVSRLLPAALARRARPAVGALSALVLLALLGSHGSETAGLTRRLRPDDGLVAAMRALPKDALVAGWPTGVINDVPYLARRRVLLTYETHQAYHKQYLDEMRRRMHALIEAYFATDGDPIARLRRDFGVTHVLVDLALLERPRVPRYFAPFGPAIELAVRRASGRPYELIRLLPATAVYRDARHAILDLRRLPGSQASWRSTTTRTLRPAAAPADVG